MNIDCIESVIVVAQSSISTNQIALIGGIVILTFVTLMSICRRRRDGGPSPQAYVRELTSRMKEEKAIQGDLSAIMLQLEQMAREINAQLDAKFHRLENVIAKADDRLEQLERLGRRLSNTEPLDLTLTDDLGDESNPPPPPGATRPADLRERIQTMSDAGQSPDEIARALNRPISEVELTVALHRTKPAKSRPQHANASG